MSAGRRCLGKMEGELPVTSEIEDYFRENGQLVEIPENTVLYDEGSKASHVFFVTKGSFVLMHGSGDRQRQSEVGQKSKGSMIGEAAALDGEPRFVSAHASEKASVLKVDTESFTHELR